LYLAEAAVALFACTSCSEPEGLWIGEVTIPYRQIDGAEKSLRAAFAAEGRATLIWHLLDGGLAEEALLHAAAAEESARVREAALGSAARLRAGEGFEKLRAEQTAGESDAAQMPIPQKPGPFFLGASVAARIAKMEPGDWDGPIRTAKGWEIVRLVERADAPRALAQVRVDRLVFPVGTLEQQLRAREDWVKLDLAGNPELLDALPLEFRHNRIRARPAAQ
jgi:hypothetical protein